MDDLLLIVALRTDQPNIKRRVATILAACEPVNDEMRGGYAEVTADAPSVMNPVALKALFGDDAAERLTRP